MSFIKLSRFFLPLSGLLVLASVVLFVYPGPRLSIEFTGGTQVELQLPQGKTQADLVNSVHSFQATPAIVDPIVTKTKTGTFFARMRTLTNEEHTSLVAHLKSTLGDVKELQYTTIGPTVGASLKQRAVWALIAASVAIMLFLAFSFRRVPRSLNPWSFGACAIAALIHDVLLVLGIFTILSYTTTFQVDTLFVTALLSIMGHSVSDTIVIFDRIREKLNNSGRKDDLADIADAGLRECLSRTFNTGVGVLIMLTSLFLFGSESIRYFMLTLIIGTIIGMYSSYFIATPLLVYWRKRAERAGK